MKKILFALICALTLTLSSCFDGTRSSYTTSFSRIVTIDTTSSSVKFVADYTGEELKGFTNLTYPEQLSQFGLEEALRAEVLMQLHIDESYKSMLTMLQGKKIDIHPVTNKTPVDSLMPLSGWWNIPLNGTGLMTVVWVSDRFLNVRPEVPSAKAGKFYLIPDSVVSDTLHFSLKASYEPAAAKPYYYEDIQCYDLRTLCDTANADAALRAKMRNMLTAMEEHRNDSMQIVLTALFDIHYYEKDTIMAQSAMTNYFRPNKVLTPNN